MKDAGHRAFALQESQTTLQWLYQALADRMWLNHPDDIYRASSKIRQLVEAAKLGFVTPETLITNEPEALLDFQKALRSDLAIKTLGPPAYAANANEQVEIRGLYTKRIGVGDLKTAGSVAYCPIFVQRYIEKEIELRVTVVEEEVFSCAIYSQERKETKHDWRHPRHVWDLKHVPTELPPQVSEGCILFLKRFNLRFGAFDFIRTPSGEYVFVECNPNGQWLWIEDLTRLRITESLVSLFQRETRTKKEVPRGNKSC